MKYHLQYIAIKTFITQEVRRFLRIWPQTFVPPIVTSTLYFTIFGTLLAQRIQFIGEIPFIQYITPGLIMMHVITASYSQATFALFNGKFQRSIEPILASPTPIYILLLGYVCGAVLRSFTAALFILMVAFAFGVTSIDNLGLYLLTITLAAVISAIIGLINGVYAKSFDDISWITSLVLTPLSYLGGIFYAIEDLPPFGQTLTHLNPIYYLITLLRYSMLPLKEVNAAFYTGILLALTIALWTLTIKITKKKLRSI